MDVDYKDRIREIVSTADLSVVTIKQIRFQLEQEFNVDLSNSPQKKTINALILQAVTETPIDLSDRTTSPELPPIKTSKKQLNVTSSQPEEMVVKRDRVAQNDSMLAMQIQNDEKYYETRNGRSGRSAGPVKAKKEKERRSTAGDEEESVMKKEKLSNIRVMLRASEALQVITGSARVTRQDVVKKIWEHVKEHGLKDEKDGRIIVCDAVLERIFGQRRVGMFKMNALLSKHLYKSGEKNDTESEEDSSLLSSSIVSIADE